MFAIPSAVRRRRHLTRAITRTAAMAILAAATLLAALTASASGAEPNSTGCQEVRVPVTLTDGTAAQLAGTLCQPVGAKAVMVTIPGITYNRAYWDFPMDPGMYSFTHAANRAGYATLTLDRLGTGASTHPLSTEVNLVNGTFTVHQVIQALRAGTIGSGYRRVIELGHSWGAITAYTEAGLFRDVDAVVTAGISHRLNLADAIRIVLGSSRPATLDPQFVSKRLDPGYLTISASVRADAFYAPGTSDPAVIAEDERLKDVYSATDFISYLPEYLNPSSRMYEGPVLVINGQADRIMCGTAPLGIDCSSGAAVAAAERAFYGAHAQVDGIVVPDTAHDLQLSTTAPTTNRQILGWVDATLSHL
ncbi:alpha/beta fold hydrolase [Amycolatopsis sp. GM8]|uniref:alpha/beta fold hydrolase n=1 Tax=Amycolatopsis sp. GM8 TaxID=2896530 RepID=UPI001F24A43B|nr:alpha/beta fold hydrolase [Amycolatopsis sp. GM8]